MPVDGVAVVAARVPVAAQEADTRFGVTLWVGGTMISGYLVGRTAYFRGLRDVFREAMGDEDSFDAMFDSIAASAIEQDAPKDEGEDDDERVIGFVHLRDARTFVAGQQPVPANRGVWWRGRIEQIDGFAFGVLGVA